jgi:hypothetical protein
MLKMKISALILGMLFLISNLKAEDKIEVPKMFVDSKIVLTLKDGRQFNFDGNEWMVVRRKAKKSLAILAPVKEKKKEEQKKVVENKESSSSKKNRVRLMGGIGPSGFDSERRKNTVKVETTEDTLGGIGYDRLIDDKFSLGGQVLSNGTYTIGVGLDF